MATADKGESKFFGDQNDIHGQWIDRSRRKHKKDIGTSAEKRDIRDNASPKETDTRAPVVASP
jgi:hypothetical protein